IYPKPGGSITRNRALGDHRKQRPLDLKVKLACATDLLNHLTDAQPLPQLPEHVQIPVRPSIHYLPRRVLSDDFFRRAAAQNAARQALEPLGAGRIIGAAAVVEDLD